RGRRPLLLGRLALGRQDRLDRVGNATGERDLDEDQGLVDQRRMKEGVAAPVGLIDARAQIVPVANSVHCLIFYYFFEEARGGGPVDAAQHQEAAVEPGGEQVEEIVVD